MRKNKLVMGLFLIVLVALWGGGLAYAKGTTSHNPMTDSDTIKTQNARQKTPHSARKEAAKRLKAAHQQHEQQHQHDGANAHHGQGQAGDDHHDNQTPKSSQRGVQ